MSGNDWTCKECGTDSDYYETVKKLDPRPGVRRVICGDCWSAIMAKLASAHKSEPSARDFRTDKMFKRSGTSEQAAQDADKAAKLGDTHRKIYRYLRDQGPATPDRVAIVFDMERNTVRARITELTKAGWLEETGDTELTPAGKPANIMRAVERAV